MSTKIYNGIKFKSSNIKEVLDQLIKLKKVDWMTWENKGLYTTINSKNRRRCYKIESLY